MNAAGIQYRLRSVILKRFCCAKDLPGSLGLNCCRSGSFTRNSIGMGRGTSEVDFQSEISREILRPKDGLQDDRPHECLPQTLHVLNRALKFIFAASIFVGLSGCSGGNSQSAPQASAPPTVVVTAVKSQLLHTTVPLPAQIKPYESVDVFPKESGFITAIPVDRGSRVKAGKLLVKLSAPELVAQRTQAESFTRSLPAFKI